jgi:uncharacterized protein (TIGR03437 family)
MNTDTKSILLGLVGIAAIFVPASCWAQSYTISTIAGGGNTYFYPGTGDGGQATSAGLGNPCNDVALDGGGNLYIAAGTLIRKVSPSGIISTVAGGGSNVGDGGQATDAELSPVAIAVDASANLYIADSTFGLFRIRKVDTKGVITTVAGGAECCGLGDGGPATDAYLAIPYGLAVDSAGDLYIAQANGGAGNLVRKVSANGVITTVAGGGTATGDGGPATGASLASPLGVAVDTAGNLFITEANGNRVRKVSKSGTITTIAGIDSPWHVTVDASGNLYVTQSSDAVVRLITPDGAVATIAGTGVHGLSGDGGPAMSAMLDLPAGIALGSHGTVYVADATLGTARVRLLTPLAPPTAPPSIASGGIVSAGAFGAFTSVAPGSWIEIYGANLAADSRLWSGADFNGVNAPTLLDGTKVTVGGQSAFVSYISPAQVNVQVPSNVGTGSQPINVSTAAGASAPYTITVNPQQPGLLAPNSFIIGGKQYIAAFFQDGAFALPPGAIAGVASRRAHLGDILTLWGIGFGPVTPNTPAGQLVQQLNTLAAPFHILFGQTEATLQYDGLAPSAVGLYQFNLVVPNVAASDTVPLTFTLGGVAGTQTLYIAVQ